ncbi:3-oxoacyl-(acyl-carrier-protein) reductase, putative [Parvibaculum lavamentivorans DS-1]|uniref:3-oxoacyl-(Acyl-carrier-protein) reductase, putative n=1 Tax=Parvibaculum lavamentivorans (strain DS-1 / DSM 13023 / NCIMB 13966) TaxID=402881 RepID=A7HT87_PARL1|nr:3-ketoacyl-ACP reductase FabG2 [Parvibaculum lavamentivorans]ABS63120.1 3-oxoacyl-(acyl-carrier-protein) reductase, putative [Parvibaculum lavamentivorans DS-1]
MSENAKRGILVTGASKGIGRAIALRVARDGFPVTVHYGSDKAGADETRRAIEEAGGTARILGFDIANRAASLAALEADLAAYGAYWGIVLNAGIARDNAFPALTGEDWDGVVDTNLGGFFNVVHPLVMPMIRRRDGGRVVTISSVSGITGNRGQVNYSAAKAGIIGATKALAVELATRKITVNCVAPGVIETAMIEAAPVEEILKMIPMQRLGQPDEIAGIVAFILSDEAGYMTRQVISVNGGMC